MYCLLYFDTEDYFSPPDAPVHRLPGQFADIMRRHCLVGCFHIHGEKARFMERHGQTDVIEAVRQHDVSLHYDRGSVHPTTAEEVSNLDWFRGVERVLFRELTGFQTLHRVFGKCSGITQHGGTFAAQIVYAAGKMGYPFLYSPFQLPGRGVVWYCNNLLMAGAGGRGGVFFDRVYRDTPRFEENLAKVDGYLTELAQQVDYWAMFGCHPVNTVMEAFPDAVNFANGASPPRQDWQPPTPVKGASIPLILENFERYIVKLVSQSAVEWTTVAGIAELFGSRPVEVSDADVVEGATQVVAHRGPTFTSLLTAGELLYPLALRSLEPSDTYGVPQVMGPTEESRPAPCALSEACDVGRISREIVTHVMGSGYLPVALSQESGGIGPEAALALLACHAIGRRPADVSDWDLTVDAIPGMAEATERVEHYRDWRPHGPQYNQEGILKHFRLQAWTLKPALTRDRYPDSVRLGRHLNAMFA